MHSVRVVQLEEESRGGGLPKLNRKCGVEDGRDRQLDMEAILPLAFR